LYWQLGWQKTKLRKINKMANVLYIIVRNDLDSMNPGKAIAQGSHAANAFVKEVNDVEPDCSDLITWQNETKQGFGTVYVLEANEADMTDTINRMSSLGYYANTILDPTYPILDGKICHHISLVTCGYVFVPKKDTDLVASLIMGGLPLHK
jgi:peptidyl-tRNA hydrolase